MGAWSVDIIGHIECIGLGSQRMPIKNGGTSQLYYSLIGKAYSTLVWNSVSAAVLSRDESHRGFLLG